MGLQDYLPENKPHARLIEEAERKRVADERRAVERAYYVRRHAPTILAGLLTRQHLWLNEARSMAITEAGLLFDETEPK